MIGRLGCCFHILPLQLSESITDYEKLCQVIQKINEVIDQLEEFENSVIDNYATKAELEMLRSQVNQDLNNLKLYVNQQVALSKAYVDGAVARIEVYINSQLGAIWKALNKNNSELQAWVRNQIYQLMKKIPELQNVHVINPINGVLQPLQQVLDEMFQFLNVCALTAAEYDALELTAERYDNAELTAWEYDFQGKCILTKLKKCCEMMNPFTGLIDDSRQVIYQIVDLTLRQNGITAGAYDTLELTSAEYDNKQLTAYAYDFTGVPA